MISTLLGIPYGSVESQNKRAVKYHKEAYFNTIELVNLSGEDMEMALQTCREQGVKVIIGDPGLMPGSNLGEEEILQKMQDYAAYDDTIRGFFICDEPHHKQDRPSAEACSRQTDVQQPFPKLRRLYLGRGQG